MRKNGNRFLDFLFFCSVAYILMSFAGCGGNEYSGDKIWEGNYEIKTKSDVDKLRDYKEVTGKIFIRSELDVTELSLNTVKLAKEIYMKANNNVKSFSMPLLEKTEKIELGGRFNYETTSLESVSFPNLKNGILWIEGSALVNSIEIPLLESGGIYISGCADLETVSAPLLENGMVYITNNSSLKEISCPVLKTTGTGSFLISYNNNLKSFEFPELREMNSGGISDNSILESFSLPKLEKMGGNPKLSTNNSLKEIFFPELKEAREIKIEKNNALKLVDLPKLVSTENGIEILHNPALEFINMPKLQIVGSAEYESFGYFYIDINLSLKSIDFSSLEKVVSSFRMTTNWALPSSYIYDLLDRIVVGGTIDYQLNSWKDPDTNYQWSKIAYKQKDEYGYGNSIKMNFEDASGYCDALNEEGFEDWRLPTIEELETLIRGDCTGFRSCSKLGDTGLFWSSTPVNDEKMWTYTFVSNGKASIGRGEKDELHGQIRCVRE